ncbi:MAG TPA: hypothetical protein VF116_16275 [Ktedonobacterales bacterium]
MKPEDVSNAITQALIQGGAQWLVATLVAFLPALWTMSLVLHLARPYVLRTLRRCGLRLGADVWWMSYLLMRDAVLVITFALSWIFFQPNLVTTLPLPITGSLAALCLLLALAVKLTRRADDDIAAYRWTTVFLIIGATLFYVPQVFAVEAASQEHLTWFANNLVSNANVPWALAIMWIAMAGVALVAAWFFFRALASASRGMARRVGVAAAPPVRTRQEAQVAQ